MRKRLWMTGNGKRSDDLLPGELKMLLLETDLYTSISHHTKKQALRALAKNTQNNKFTTLLKN